MIRKLAVAVLAVALFGVAAWTLSPWPAALVYRFLMDRGGVAMNDALAKHVPAGVVSLRDVAYDPTDAEARLDLHRPATSEGRRLPMVVWVHGGAFLSGSKEQVANYLRIIAADGYVTAGIGYGLAPRSRYPRPVQQLSAALRFLDENAERFSIDASRIVLAGDSAGAQIAAQTSLVISSPDYAARMGLSAPIPRTSLRGAVLFCGFLDPDAIDTKGAFGGFLRTAIWSYFGTKDVSSDPRMAEFSIVKSLTAAFPPLFVSAGNADPLAAHSERLVRVASGKGVAVDSLFFPADRTPGLPHEYQFDLDTEAGRLARERLHAFLERRLR